MQKAVTSPPRRIATAIEAEHLIAQISETLNSLVVVIEEETELVRQGRITQASRLGARKAEFAGRYYAATERLKANREFLKAALPQEMDALRRRHDAFRPLLQTNLTVLATARAVSEGIMRGVAGELTRKSAPQTYGGSGRPTAPAPSAARPVMVSRVM
jgi:hypothetical protein